MTTPTAPLIEAAILLHVGNNYKMGEWQLAVGVDGGDVTEAELDDWAADVGYDIEDRPGDHYQGLIYDESDAAGWLIPGDSGHPVAFRVRPLTC